MGEFNILEVILRCKEELLERDKEVTPTWLMWEVMNEVFDSELRSVHITIEDVATMVMEVIERG